MSTTTTTPPPVRSADRTRPRRRRWPFVLAGGLVLVVLAVGAWVIWFSSLLAVRTVLVGGTDEITAAAVRLSLAHHEGTPLASIDLAAVKAELLAQPDIAEAEVIRQWPDTLVAEVKSRTPVAVTSANGALWLVDSSGVVYRPAAPEQTGLVTVELATPGPQDPATLAALAVVGSMTADFREHVATVVARTEFAVTVNLKDGRVVFWGGADRSVRKMQILPALLQQPGQQFDLSDPDLVTVRPTG